MNHLAIGQLRDIADRSLHAILTQIERVRAASGPFAFGVEPDGATVEVCGELETLIALCDGAILGGADWRDVILEAPDPPSHGDSER